MSLIEGGNRRCDIHDFEADNIPEWNEHCFETGHTESGETCCITCGETIEFNNLPFPGLDATGAKNIQLRCEECETKIVGKAKVRKVSKFVSSSVDPQPRVKMVEEIEK